MVRVCSLSNHSDILIYLGIVLSCLVGAQGGWLDSWLGLGNNDDSSPPVKVLYGESHGISLSNVDATERQDPILEEQGLDVFGLDYHYNYSLVFFSGRGKIWSSKLNDTKEQHEHKKPEVLVEDAPGAGSVAVDWIHDRVYWVDPDGRTVNRVQLSGEERQIIIKDTGDISRMNNLVLDPYQRLMFLAVEGVGFLRTDLHGQDSVSIKVQKLQYPREMTLTIDIHSQRLYVSNREDLVPQIITCNYDGTKVAELNVLEDWGHSFISIGVFNNKFLFWVDHVPNDRDSVSKAFITDLREITKEVEYRPLIVPPTRIWALKVFHPDLQSLPKPEVEAHKKNEDTTIHHEDHNEHYEDSTEHEQKEIIPTQTQVSEVNSGSPASKQSMWILFMAGVTYFNLRNYIQRT